MLGVPFYVMDVPRRARADRRAAAGSRERGGCRRGSALDLVDALVEIHAADVTTPALAAFVAARELPRAAGPPLHAALGDQQDARASRRSTRSATRLARRRARAAAADGRPRRLPAREHDGRAATIRRGSSRCSTGRWARSATRAPTSATCSRRTASRAAAPNPLGTSPGDGARRASRRAPSSSSATSQRSGRGCRAARVVRGALRSGRRRCSARRSTGGTCSGELAAEDERARRFEQECRSSRSLQRLPSRGRDRLALPG